MSFGRRKSNGWLIGGSVLLAGLLGHSSAIAFRRVLRGEFSDFNAFYSAAAAMLSHGDPYAPQHRNYIYPPLIAFLYSPLAMLPQGVAATVLICVNVAIVALALGVAAREVLRRLDCPRDRPAVVGVCAVALLLLSDKVRGEIQMFQTNALILLMFTLGLRWLDRRPTWAGAALGLACNIKYYPVIMLPYLLVRRRWAAAGGLVLGAVAFALLPAVLSGWDANRRHLSIAFGGLARMVGIDEPGAQAAKIGDVKSGFSLSITSAVARTAHRLGAEGLTIPVVAGIAAVLLGAIALLYWRNGVPLLRWPGAAGQSAEQPYRALVAVEWVGLMAIALTFSPQTNSRHLVMLLATSTVLAVMLLFPRRGAARWPLVVAAALLLVGLAFPWGGTQSEFARQFKWWRSYAGPSWCVLGAFLLVARTGVRYARAAEDGEPVADTFGAAQADAGGNVPPIGSRLNGFKLVRGDPGANLEGKRR